MKKATTILLLALSFSAVGQTPAPKQHVFYDTLKTVKERVDYSPDTIPVFFKELRVKIININRDSIKMKPFIDTVIVEGWTPGYVIWQTYKKQNVEIQVSPNFTFYPGQPFIGPYYKDEFKATEFSDNKFLYADKKTRVTNKVLYTILR